MSFDEDHVVVNAALLAPGGKLASGDSTADVDVPMRGPGRAVRSDPRTVHDADLATRLRLSERGGASVWAGPARGCSFPCGSSPRSRPLDREEEGKAMQDRPQRRRSDGAMVGMSGSARVLVVNGSRGWCGEKEIDVQERLEDTCAPALRGARVFSTDARSVSEVHARHDGLELEPLGERRTSLCLRIEVAHVHMLVRSTGPVALISRYPYAQVVFDRERIAGCPWPVLDAIARSEPVPSSYYDAVGEQLRDAEPAAC